MKFHQSLKLNRVFLCQIKFHIHLMELFIMTIQDRILILDTMIYMGTIDIDIMQTNIYIVMAIQRLKMIKKYVFLFIFLIIISGCSLSPGMHMDTESTWFENDSSVFVESLNKELPIEKIENNIRETSGNYVYKIGKGDQIAITVWDCLKFSACQYQSRTKLKEG